MQKSSSALHTMANKRKGEKSGQARVPTLEQQRHLFKEIKKHRHPEKNTAIMQISFCLGLRVQEIALLEVKEVCTLGPARKTTPRTYALKEVLKLPASYTKGSNAMGRSRAPYDRKTLSFKIGEFDRIIENVAKLSAAGVDVDPKTYYPDIQQRSGKGRDLPMVDEGLRDSLQAYLQVRVDADISIKPTDPLFMNQKGRPYSPNSLQNHMKLMLTGWAGIEGASSHSGRRALLTDIIHNQGKSVKVAQKIAGHKSAATTLIYEEPPETTVAEALKGRKK